jgi:two-component system cell cycle sensor histidine kinase/response regulator CckA
MDMATLRPVSLLRTRKACALLFAQNPLPMWLIDGESLQFLEVNDAAIDLYGYSREEFGAMRITEVHSAGEVNALLGDRPGGGGPFRRAGIWRHRRKDGSVVEIEVHSRALQFPGRAAVLAVMHDVSEQRRLEHQLLHAQKLEAVGRLAGGVAHDFNNLLTAVLGYSDLMLANPELPSSVAADAREIRQAATSAAELTRQLLAFGRKQLIQPIALNVTAALERLERLLQRVIGEHIRIAMRLDPSVATVRLDPGQFEQIIVNLAVNARDAMPGGGVLTIETSTQRLDDAYARQHLAVVPGDYVMVAISDTGDGIDADVLPHIFEPFFTTKPTGKGTGLGLATVYGVVKQNEGNIWVYSEPAHGTTFKIYFPALHAATHAETTASELSAPGGTETILVVEDDARLRRLAERTLSRLGYTVLVAASSHEALRLAAWHDRAINLLFTDVVLPDIPGPVLASKICALVPAMKVLFASGYTEGAIAHHGIVEPGVVFLAKPFTPDGLARKIREVLDGRAACP